MSTLHQIELTLYGQEIEGLAVPIGGTVHWVLHLQDPISRQPIDLTGGNVILSLSQLDVKGNPILPALISRQANITAPATGGNVTADWVSGDTAPLNAPLSPGVYGLDVWITDASGNRQQTMTHSYLTLMPVSTLPTSPVTPLPAQLPLAQGPQGVQGPAGSSGLVQVVHRTISQPADGSDFFVTLNPQVPTPYSIGQNQLTGAYQVFYQYPNGVNDRTSSQFHVLTSSPLPDGTLVDFLIYKVTP